MTYANDQDKDHIFGSLELEFEASVCKVSGSASVTIDNNETLTEGSYQLRWYCDASPDEVPTTMEEAIEVAKKLPSMVTEKNDGKGVPVQFTFTSIAKLKKIFKVICLSSVKQVVLFNEFKRFVSISG